VTPARRSGWRACRERPARFPVAVVLGLSDDRRDAPFQHELTLPVSLWSAGVPCLHRRCVNEGGRSAKRRRSCPMPNGGGSCAASLRRPTAGLTARRSWCHARRSTVGFAPIASAASPPRTAAAADRAPHAGGTARARLPSVSPRWRVPVPTGRRPGNPDLRGFSVLRRCRSTPLTPRLGGVCIVV
jgi:hypothetical protein